MTTLTPKPRAKMITPNQPGTAAAMTDHGRQANSIIHPHDSPVYSGQKWFTVLNARTDRAAMQKTADKMALFALAKAITVALDDVLRCAELRAVGRSDGN